MRLSIALSAALLLAFVMPARPQAVSPVVTTVEPALGTVNDTFVAKGTNLDQAHVADVFLTDGKNDIKGVIVEQTATSIKFKAARETHAGRFALMVLTKGSEPCYVEEPAKLTIQAED